MNYYQLFELESAPLLDKSSLKKKYLQLSREYHPDFADNNDEESQTKALEVSANINKAYKIFNNPSLSIQYFLQHKEVISEEEKFPLPPDFLMDMMDINEALEDAKASGNQTEIGAISHKIAMLEEELYTAIAEIVTTEAPQNISADQLAELKLYYYKKKYLQRILEGLS